MNPTITSTGGRASQAALEAMPLLPSIIAKYALALRKISFAWRSSRFSRSSAFIFSAMSGGMPAGLPLSTSALPEKIPGMPSSAYRFQVLMRV